MTSILIDQEKAKHHIPIEMRAVARCEKHMVWQAGALVRFPLRGVRINDLNPLWPASHLRTFLLGSASNWLAQVRRLDYEMLGAEGDILVFGPMAPRLWENARGPNPYVTARGEDELQQTDTVEFIFKAKFLAGRAYVPKEDHEIMSARAGADYDKALKDTHGDVFKAIMKLPAEVRGPSQSASLALDLLVEREKKAAAPFGG